MKCPYCGFSNTGVVESRVMTEGNGVRRRRECGKCEKRFTTYEKIGNIELRVVKRSGVEEEFDREKLEKGILKSCWKRPVTNEMVEQIGDEIEMRLLNRKSTLVKSTDIGKLVLSRLKKVDSIAYLRFASVYLDFDNLGDFKEVLLELDK